MEKYEEIAKLQKLKENGSITDKEFEIEKYKILNNNVNNREKNTNGIYIASLILGICSLVFGAVPFLGLILGIVAIVICLIARKKMKINGEKSGLVTAGIITTVLGLLLATLVTMRILVVLTNSRSII